jgi:hypothetical protein
MAITDDNPIRLQIPRPYRRPQLPIESKLVLPLPGGISESFLSTLLRRRSAEHFPALSVESLSTWLHFCGSIQSVHAEDQNRQRRYVASFGGLHALSILLGQPDNSWSVYLPEHHMLGSLRVHISTARSLRASAETHYNSSAATLVVLVANENLVSAYYDNARDLISREAGVLLGHGSLVAASLGLAFRILGGSGSPWGEQMISEAPFNVRSVGMAWLGASRNGR